MKTAHGIMFHHFHGKGHFMSPGSLSSEQMDALLDAYAKDYDLISAQEWFEKAVSNKLSSKDVCVTFDDALLSQYEIAAPVLESRKLTAFWFVYTSVVEGGIEPLEIHRKFRATSFQNINQFYSDFFNHVETSQYSEQVQKALLKFDPSTYLNQFPFYSMEDRKFRFIRDIGLEHQEYSDIMDLMIRDKGLTHQGLAKDLWLKENHIKNLFKQGHVFGLHSHSHPLNLKDLSFDEQKKEYIQNMSSLKSITGNKIEVMSHPSNSYNYSTLDILKDLGVKIGFCSNTKGVQTNAFEFPREDHSNIVKEYL